MGFQVICSTFEKLFEVLTGRAFVESWGKGHIYTAHGAATDCVKTVLSVQSGPR